VVKPTLRRLIATGAREFVFVPLFLGPSRAITDYLPELIAEARVSAPDLQVVVADTLAGVDLTAPDMRLAEMLADNVRLTMQAAGLSHPRVALVDHGTPAEVVNQVRNAVAGQLAELLQTEVAAVAACSMERREGSEYDFNEPLLERIAQLDGWASADVIVALFFLLPGRHAGAGGDVVEICDGLIAQHTLRSTVRTPLLGEHPQLVDILVDRLRAALDSSVEQA
jgi:sirohydrochlorin ferrochelatase